MLTNKGPGQQKNVSTRGITSWMFLLCVRSDVGGVARSVVRGVLTRKEKKMSSMLLLSVVFNKSHKDTRTRSKPTSSKKRQAEGCRRRGVIDRGGIDVILLKNDCSKNSGHEGVWAREESLKAVLLFLS